MSRIWPRKIRTPHVDLGVSLPVGVAVLRSTGAVISEELDREQRTYRVSLPGYQMAIYDGGGFVSSVWYDDPAGRLTPFGKRQKIKLYMERFTKNGSWQLRLNNGWMKFYFNDVDHVQLVYGLHMDVIRINSLARENAAISESFGSFAKGLQKQSDSADPDEIGEIIKRDDRDAIAKLVESGALDIEAEDRHGRTPIEQATIAASPKVINYLLEKGARLRASLELAKTNAEYFEGHRAIVSLLERSRKTMKRSE